MNSIRGANSRTPSEPDWSSIHPGKNDSKTKCDPKSPTRGPHNRSRSKLSIGVIVTPSRQFTPRITDNEATAGYPRSIHHARSRTCELSLCDPRARISNTTNHCFGDQLSGIDPRTLFIKPIVHGVAAHGYVSQLRDLVKVELGNLLTEQAVANEIAVLKKDGRSARVSRPRRNGRPKVSSSIDGLGGYLGHKGSGPNRCDLRIERA